MGTVFCRSAGFLRVASHSLNRSHLRGRKSGTIWEKTAESFLRAQGLELLQRNFYSRFGEIDLVMKDEQTLVFIEVKYRKNSHHGSGAEAVTLHKQNRISRTAAWYLAKNPHRAECVCRFDVISITPEEMGQGINWIKNAFYSTMD